MDQSISQKLRAPFPLSQVQWRIGATNSKKTSGLAVPYVDARTVMARFDDVLGFGMWGDNYKELGERLICEISVKIDNEWVVRSDGCATTGEQDDTEYEKGGLSDAFKRAAVKWGVGRYLYFLPQCWVEIEPYGKSHKMTTKPDASMLPAWAIPQPKDTPSIAA